MTFRILGHGLYTKKQLLQHLDVVGVVFSLSGFVQLLCEPPETRVRVLISYNSVSFFCLFMGFMILMSHLPLLFGIITVADNRNGGHSRFQLSPFFG